MNKNDLFKMKFKVPKDIEDSILNILLYRRIDYRFIQFIKNSSEKVQLHLIKQMVFGTKELLKIINNPTTAFLKEVLRKDPDCLECIEPDLLTPEILEYFVQLPIEIEEGVSFIPLEQCIRYCKCIDLDIPESVYIASIKKYPFSIDLIDFPSEKMKLLAISEGYRLKSKWLKQGSEEIHLAAVSKTPSILFSLKNPTEYVKQVALDTFINKINKME